jgi:hypothetical protein
MTLTSFLGTLGASVQDVEEGGKTELHIQTATDHAGTTARRGLSAIPVD